MSSLNFPDTNVWLALVWERHAYSGVAHAWFDACGEEQFLFCRFTQLGLLRMVTNKVVMGNDVQSMADAWDVYDACCADERIAFLDEPDGLEAKFRSMAKSRRRIRSPRRAWAAIGT